MKLDLTGIAVRLRGSISDGWSGDAVAANGNNAEEAAAALIECRDEIERLRAQLAAERKRCAGIADARAKVWNDAVEAGTHENCAMSLAEECEDIAAVIRRTDQQNVDTSK